MSLVWSDEHALGLPEIDSQHMIFVAIINELYKAIENEELEDHLEPILEKLIGYAQYHFGTEEEYFARFDYEGAAVHIADHRRIIDRIQDFQGKHHIVGTDMVSELATFLSDWLLNHTHSMDSLYVECFKLHGLGQKK